MRNCCSRRCGACVLMEYCARTANSYLQLIQATVNFLVVRQLALWATRLMINSQPARDGYDSQSAIEWILPRSEASTMQQGLLASSMMTDGSNPNSGSISRTIRMIAASCVILSVFAVCLLLVVACSSGMGFAIAHVLISTEMSSATWGLV